MKSYCDTYGRELRFIFLVDRDLVPFGWLHWEDPQYCLLRRPYFWQIVIEFVKGVRELVDHFLHYKLARNLRVLICAHIFL